MIPLAAEIDTSSLKPVHRIHEQHAAVVPIQVPVRASAITGSAHLCQCRLVHGSRRHVPEEGDVIGELNCCSGQLENCSRLSTWIVG